MQHTIIIQYVSGPKLDQKAEYRYDIQLSADQQFKVDYFTGKQRDVQMTALGLALDNALPADAVIKAINYVPFEATKTDFLEMLKRKDDYVATILFETMSETAVDEATDESSTADNQATDTNKVTTDQAKSAVNTAAKTGSQTDTVKETIEYQPANSHAYQTLDLQQKEPAATEKVRKVGISKLSYVFNYGDLQKIISNDKVDVFQTPIGVVPSNGSITPTRRHTFSENAGLDTTALDDAKVVKLDTVTNSNNQKEYSVYAFEASKQEPKQPETATAPASQPETATAPASQPETATAPASQPETATAPASQPETAIAPASQPETTTAPASQPETTTAPASQSETTTAPASQSETTTAPASQSETTTAPASQSETTTAPASQPETATELHALREQIAQLSSKMDNSLVQENNDLAVAFNKIELKLNELTTRLQSPLPTANNNDALDIKQKLDQILTNQAKSKTKQPATLNELIIQQSNLTDADLKQIPNRIKDQCFNHNEELPIERANYIFQIIAYLKDNFNIPEDLKCLSDPELFLKVVHLLSWFN